MKPYSDEDKAWAQELIDSGAVHTWTDLAYAAEMSLAGTIARYRTHYGLEVPGRRYPAPRDHTISVRVSQEGYDYLQSRCEKTGETMSSVIRDMLAREAKH